MIVLFLRDSFSLTNRENMDIIKDIGGVFEKGFYMLKLLYILIFLMHFKHNFRTVGHIHCNYIRIFLAHTHVHV